MAAAEEARKPMLQHALDYLALGYPVFPVCSPLMGAHQHRVSGNPQDCPLDKRGKTPMVPWKAFQADLPTATEVRAWWSRWPSANIGMATGSLSGVVVLDCDSGEARQLALDRGGLEKAPAVWTGTPGGIHFWMAHPGYEVRNFVRDIPGTDFRGDGGYVLLPPSVHRNHGAVYRWNEHTLGMRPPAVPPWLEALFRAKEAPAASGEPFTGDALDVEAMLRGFDEGHRDDGLFRLACRFRHDDQPQPYAEALIQVAARNCRPAFDPAEAVEKVRYVYGKYSAGGIGPAVVFDEEIVPPERAAGTPPDPAPDIVFLRPISELLKQPYRDPDWLVQDLFTVASNGWIGAEPKVGKSWLALELAYCLATGQPFLGTFSISSPRRVAYIQEEDSDDRTHRRLQRIIDGDPLRPKPPDSHFMYSIRSGFRLDSPAWIVYLRRDIESFKPDVIILDVFNRLHGSDENKQQEMTAILRVLTGLTNQYGCAFIVVHHNRKPQQGNEARGSQSLRGSGVLGSWGECSLYLRPGKDKNQMIVTPESKDAPEMDDFTITIEDQENGSVVLVLSDMDVETRIPKGDADVIDAVRRITGYGVGATIKAIAEDLEKDRTTIQKRLTRLVEAGYLTAKPISDLPKATLIYAVVS